MPYVEVSTPSGDSVSVYADGPPPAKYATIPAAGASGLLVGTAVVLLGWSLYESTGAAAAVMQLVNGNTVNGDIPAGLSLAAGASNPHSIGTPGVLLDKGLYFSAVSGQMAGSIFYRHWRG
jgi:hypothetical protein